MSERFFILSKDVFSSFCLSVSADLNYEIKSILFPFAHVTQWFATRNNFVPKGHLAMSGDILGCHNLRKGVTATSI